MFTKINETPISVVLFDPDVKAMCSLTKCKLISVPGPVWGDGGTLLFCLGGSLSCWGGGAVDRHTSVKT